MNPAYYSAYAPLAVPTARPTGVDDGWASQQDQRLDLAELEYLVESPASSVRTDGESGDNVSEPSNTPHDSSGRSRKRTKTRDNNDVTKNASPPPSTAGYQKPRKATYQLQKEERDELIEEARLLEARLELLKIKAGLPTVTDKNSVANVEASNFAAEEEIHANLLRLGRFQSLLSRQLQSTPVNPMSTYIHLPKDRKERQVILEAMKDLKVRRAQEVAANRLFFLDPLKPYQSEEHYDMDDGFHRFKYFEIRQFRGARDARHLYDTLLYFYANMEISVTEMIGQFTLREEETEIDRNVWNHRIVTAGDAGTTEELNLVGFSRFYDNYLPHNGAQFGVLAVDTVDVDDLNPYRPHERTRKDVQAAYAISEHKDPETQRTVVVMKTCVFMNQHPPAFPVPAFVVERLHDNMSRWLTLTNKFLEQHTNSSQY